MKKLLEYGFANTYGKTFFEPGDVITEIPVWYGRQESVAATVAKPFAITVDKKDGLKNIRVLVRYDEPIAAPVQVGDTLGEIIAQQNGHLIARAPIVAKNKVAKIRFLGRVLRNIQVMLGL